MRKIVPLLLIAISASLWGCIAIFVRGMADMGFSPMEIVAVRVAVAAIILGLVGFVKNKSEMTIRLKDLWLFIGTGIFSIVFFNWCYFTALNKMDVSLAVILLYTSPMFVSFFSFIFFKDKFTKTKIAAVAGTFIGCILVAGFRGGSETVGPLALLIGLGAGLGYALYSIFGKAALRKYKPYTITFYTFFVAAVFLVPLTRLWEQTDLLFSQEGLLYGAGLGIVPTVVAYFLYTKGLERTDSSTAAIIATVEPIVATMLGVFLYGEGMGILQMLGSAIILASVSMSNIDFTALRTNRKRLQSM
ncbi:EamA family transporter [Neobacillus notoginsengisoli]|uniref:EamA family transporter n=1 Tax=Neobacillus notoginsengisoli TaxID=1578198 RepID=A0A417YXP1_9BACI|nr:DMT family transporter [Neobacillus notoginsengisoli]RHW42299.1 EamA family transporter [Neobacillus notoginsengisoli]